MNRRYAEQLASINGAEQSNWFKNWFDSSYYHKLYAHRNEAEAARFISILMQNLNPAKGSRMLDLGCGAGRHSKHLAAYGNRVTGIDLALSSIIQAKEYESEMLHFRQHDMRYAFGKDHFDYVFNFFTSFGYFQSDEENSSVVRNISNALKPGGVAMIDYLNVYHAELRQVPAEVKVIDGVFYHINRWMDPSHFYKKIEIRDHNTSSVGTHVEKVAKLRQEDFERLFVRHGLELFGVFGDYELAAFDKDNSPRLVLMARKKTM